MQNQTSFDPALKKKLGYLVPEFPQQTHAFFWREMSAMRDLGARVVLCSTRRPPDDACPHDFAAAARAETRYLFPPNIPAALGFLARRPAGLAKALAYVAGLAESSLRDRAKALALILVAAEMCRLARDEGIGHLHIHSCAASAHIGALAQCLGGPSYSLTLHGHLPVYGRDHARKMAGARFVSTVTRPLQADVQALGVVAHVPVVSMGVDTAKFRPPETRAEGPMTFLSVARLNVVKGHALFLEAMRRLVDEGLDLRYRIAGSGPYEPEIRAAITRLGLADRVEMLGSISEDAVLAALRTADAFVLTSFGEGEAAPVAVMEAMATGLPVICSRIGGTGDMITDGVDGLLVPQQDVDAIADAARRLLNEPGLALALGAAARHRAETQFDHRVKAAQLLDELRPFLGG